MVIGIDNISPGLSTSRRTVGGMRNFLADLIEGLSLANPDLEFVIFTPAWADPFPIRIPDNCRFRLCDVPKFRLGRVAYEQLVLPGIIRKSKAGFWFGMHNTLPRSEGWKSAVIIQSLQCFTQPEAFGSIRRHYLQRATQVALRRANYIVALSNHSRDQLVRLSEASSGKIVVLPHWLPRSLRMETEGPGGGNDNSEILDGIRMPYILCVSAFYRYKNILRLVKAFANVRFRFPGTALVLAGAETPELTHSEVRNFARSLGVDNSVVLAGRVDDRFMPGLYKNAALVAMPSLDETFGLPVLEALHYGCPIVTSANSPMAEVAGSAALLVDATEEKSIADGISALLADPELSARLGRNGKTEAARFAYPPAIRKYSDLIRRAIR